VRGNIPVDSKTPVVTSSISRSDLPAQSFEGAHRGRVCVCAFIGMSAYACMWALALHLVSQKKKLRFYYYIKSSTSMCINLDSSFLVPLFRITPSDRKRMLDNLLQLGVKVVLSNQHCFWSEEILNILDISIWTAYEIKWVKRHTKLCLDRKEF
jgi:hypothetical protein